MSEFDAILERLQVQAQQAAATPVGLPEVTSEGASDNEQVRATVSSGKLQSVTIDPRAMRLTNAELADLVVEAVNAAIEAQNAAVTAAMQDESTDFGQLNRNLDEIRSDANQTMAKYLDAMTEMLGRASGQR